MKFSLAICCYNFERFIEEAIDCAFAQTYRPLEIVISDDHSPDRSWEKILAKVASYGYQVPALNSVGTFVLEKEEGKLSTFTHQSSTFGLTVVLNRNPTNLGLAFHENRLFEISSGDYIAFQAGDDVSAPVRIERIAAAVAENSRIRCLHCRCDVIDAEGRPFKVPASFKRQRKVKKNPLPSILGAGAVYHKDVFSKFGPLAAFCRNEDHVLPMRASLLGEIHFLDEVLLRYRKHGANESGAYQSDCKGAAVYRLRMIGMYHQELQDLLVAEQQGLGAEKVIRRFRRLIQDEIFIHRFFGLRYLRPELKGPLLQELLFSPHNLFLFFKRAWGRIG